MKMPLTKATWRFGEIAALLSRLGYRCIPLHPASKLPAVKEWPSYRFDKSNRDSRSAPRRVGDVLVFPDFATGIVTGDVIGLDVDVRDPALVRKIKRLADRMLGAGVDRVGCPPKFLRVYRTDTPFRKIRSQGFTLQGEDTQDPSYRPHIIEVLAEGQQFVCEAIHNKTGRPYQWSVQGGLLVTPVSSLTLCTENQFREFIDAAEKVLIESGAKVYARNAVRRRDTAGAVSALSRMPAELRQELMRDAEAQSRVLANTVGTHDPKACRAALAALPNRDADYEQYWRVGVACAAALGEAGRKEFVTWSRKSKKHDREYTDQAYTGYLRYVAAGKSQITAGTLFHLAKQSGWRSKKCRPRYWQRPSTPSAGVRL